jgi:hypothetical protein
MTSLNQPKTSQVKPKLVKRAVRDLGSSLQFISLAMPMRPRSEKLNQRKLHEAPLSRYCVQMLLTWATYF